MGVFKRKDKKGVEGDTWYVDYRDPAGKRIIKAVGPKKKEAEDYLVKIKAAMCEGRFFDIKRETRLTFNELLDQYVLKVQDQRFFKNSLSYLVPILKEYFRGRFLSEIDYKMLENIRDERKKTPTKHGTERTKRAVDIELSFLRTVLNKAAQWGMLERNPFEREEDLFYKAYSRRERSLTEREVKALIQACPEYLKPIVATGIYTGLRKSDLLFLKWKDVDLERGLIRLVEAKTGKTRNIVLNEDMKTLLHNLPERSEYLFPNQDGKPFVDVGHGLEAALRKAGIKQGEGMQKIVWHRLRHTCVSLLTEKRADTTMVKNYVAHTSEEMTKRYTHLSEEYARRAADILNGLSEVNFGYGNKMETITDQPKLLSATRA
jgi:integrase